ncbi:hypothetical protein GUJ93_ZPchr0012g21648 [Zizania palustris]|uniref:Uncharacterized protein n=1 Tax=Zizania palustris TaxID=103762 RepID=A0A8J5WWB1_ZIZPA|nr:hypothetical protein GUJ93_ZPchr0012g21648 [Zizania palustris]
MVEEMPEDQLEEPAEAEILTVEVGQSWEKLPDWEKPAEQPASRAAEGETKTATDQASVVLAVDRPAQQVETGPVH